MSAISGTFHRRVLPNSCVSFTSAEGKSLFKDCMLNDELEGYFPLAENFQSQGHIAFCGLGSLTVALNALLIDPNRVWQGIWRWFDESMLDCCSPLEVVKIKGITLPKLACLAKCNGAHSQLKYATDITIDEFRQDLELISKLKSNEPIVMVGSYSRKVLNQSGSGHFSPIAAYNSRSDMVLILDVARFKYPPHWVPATLLFESMQSIDNETNKSRGYVLLKPSSEFYKDCKCNNNNNDNNKNNINNDNNNDINNNNNNNNNKIENNQDYSVDMRTVASLNENNCHKKSKIEIIIEANNVFLDSNDTIKNDDNVNNNNNKNDVKNELITFLEHSCSVCNPNNNNNNNINKINSENCPYNPSI
eukprot:gene15392-20756_t